MIPTTPDRIARGLWWMRAWSIIEGCTPVSEACRNCWSATQTDMRAQQSNAKIVARYAGLTAMGRFNGQVRPQYDSLYNPLRVKRPTTWALWNDLWHQSVPDDFIGLAIAVMSLAWWHTFVVLTKRPERTRDYLTSEDMLDLVGASQSMILRDEDSPVGPGRGWDCFARRRDDAMATVVDVFDPLPNVIWGATVEDQPTADERIPLLLDTPVARRVVSLEPMLGPIELSADTPEGPYSWLTGAVETGMGSIKPEDAPSLDWVIVGGESGPKARPMHLNWPRQVRDQCVAAGVPFFFKQWGEWGEAEFHHEWNAPTVDVYADYPMTGKEKLHVWGGSAGSVRVGKKAAGRKLDGRVWDQMPEKNDA